MAFVEEPLPTRNILSFPWTVTKNHGTTYIRVPKEFASLRGMEKGDLVTLSIWSIEKPREKKR